MLTKDAGSQNQTVDVFIQASSSTVGAGLTGLAYNTASLTCYYRRGATGTPTALTLATQTAGGAHSDGGFVELDATNMPGMYRLDLSDAIVAAGVDEVTLFLHGAANMAPTIVRVKLETPVTVADITAPFDTDAQAENTASPADTGTIFAKINQIHQALFHKKETDSSGEDTTIYQSDGSTVWVEGAASLSGTVFTVGPMDTP